MNKEKIIRNSFANRVFRDTADYDYVAARTLFRNQLFDQFLFYTQQCVEKYLKGILLFNDIKSNNLHGINKLLEKCKDIKKFEFLEETIEFIKRIDGNEHTRYLTYGVVGRKDYLLKLDKAIFDIRRFCQSDSDYINIYARKNLQELKRLNKRVIFSGKLEKILKNDNGKFSQQRSNLIWKNFYYGKNIKKQINFSFGWWSKSSAIDPENKEEYEAVNDYIYIPKKIRDHFDQKKI